MSETLDILAGAVQEIANGPRVSSFHELTEGLMRRLSEKGLTLAQLADRKMMARSVSTLEGHCREYGIAFPDYVPANMRKHVRFMQRGDFLELDGPLAGEVSNILEIVLMQRDGRDFCCVPIHGYADAKAALKAHWYEVSKAKAPKRARGPAHA